MKEIRRLIREARKAGWRIEHRGGHYRLYPLDKAHPPLTMSASPSDRNAERRARADTRRAGLDS